MRCDNRELYFSALWGDVKARALATITVLILVFASGFAEGANSLALPLVFVMHAGSESAYQSSIRGLADGLAEFGVVNGQNANVEIKWAQGNYGVFPRWVSEAVSRHATVIVTLDYVGAAKAAMDVTETIPVVFATATDPVANGLVKSLARPEGKATGVTYTSNFAGPKRLELLSKFLPPHARLGYMLNAENPFAKFELELVQLAAPDLGLEIMAISVPSESEIEPAFARARQMGVKGIFLGSDPFMTSHLAAIADAALREQMPVISAQTDFVKAGGLIGYGVDKYSSYRDVGRYAAQLILGAQVHSLPVLQPTKYSLVINAKTSKSLGLEIPPDLYAVADQIIE